MSHDVADLRLMPWDAEPGQRNSWSTGGFVSVDGAAVGPVSQGDVAKMLFHGTTGDDWDGKEAAVLQLSDGRFVAYETFWGPTGSGFSEDAYGGDADLFFGLELNNLILTALSDEGRRLCGIPEKGLG